MIIFWSVVYYINQTKIHLIQRSVFYVSDVAQLPLTKWNRIKAELIEMWQIVRAGQRISLSLAKGL